MKLHLASGNRGAAAAPNSDALLGAMSAMSKK